MNNLGTFLDKPSVKNPVQGKLQRILFQSGLPDHAHPPYTIAYFVLGEPNVGKRIKIVGNFVMEPNLNYMVRGGWKYDGKYRDWQLQISDYRELMPRSNAGFINFFASNRFFKLGLKKAKAIVSYYQTDCMQKIYRSPASLHDINALTTSDRKVIRQEINKLFEYHDLYHSFLMQGLPTRVIDVVRQNQKLTAEEVTTLIKQHSFELVKSYQIDFADADQIFQAFNPDQMSSLYRFSFLTTWILHQECYKTGDTYLSFAAFWQAVEKREARISFNQFQMGVLAAEKRQFIKIKTVINNKYFYPFYLYQSERDIVRILNEKVNRTLTTPSLNFDDIKTVTSTVFDFSLEQKMAIANAVNDPLTIINGGPGTGKTTIVKAIIDYLRVCHSNPKIILAAPTGKAAEVMKRKTNYETQTLHKLIEWEGQHHNLKLIYNPHHWTTQPITLKSKQTGILIIDEMSMVSTWLLARALLVTQAFQKIILIGDSHQLPSVESGAAFSNLVKFRPKVLTTLRKVYRHHADQGHDILTLTQLIQGGEQLRINQFLSQLPSDANVRLIETTNRDLVLDEVLSIYRNWQANHFRYDEVQVVSPMYKRSLGVDDINHFLQHHLKEVDSFPTSGVHKFQVGDKVMQIENREEVKNGEIGQITGLNLRTQTENYLKVRFSNDKIIAYAPEHLSQLKLAYACTVHKTQGNEFKETILIVQPNHQNMLFRPLLYTAITRAQRKITIIGPRITFLRGISKVPPPRHTGLGELLQTRMVIN